MTRFILDVDAEVGVLAEYFADHKIPNYNRSSRGEGWPTIVFGSYEQLEALKADLDGAGYNTNLRARGDGPALIATQEGE